MTKLPCSEELQKLPLRAIVTYASRAARRASEVFRSTAETQLVSETLSLAERVASVEKLDDLDSSIFMDAAARVVEMDASAATPEEHLAAGAVRGAARAAYAVVQALTDQRRASYYVAYAARAASAAACAADALDESKASAARKAACRDYEILRKTYGEHEHVVVGEQIDISASALLGPLWLANDV